MATLADIGEADRWRCWLCDEPVDQDISSSDPRGASVDARITKAQAKKQKKLKVAPTNERLAHIGCNTGNGTIERVVPWPEDLFVVDPAPLIATIERLRRKGGREILARCMTQADADLVAAWLIDRVSRLEPSLSVQPRIDPGGGQFLVSLVR